MAEIIGVSFWSLAGLLWGDWRNWGKYHATILYFLFCDVAYYYVAYSHRLWNLTPTWPLRYELVSLFGEFLVFASTVLIFLGRYPANRFFSIWWTLLWVAIYTANEWVLLLTGTFTYDFGWTLYKSCMVSVLQFIFLRLHFKKPLLTIILSVPMAAFLIYLCKVPIK
ncbi:hypothetical protein [Paenibacillus aestuarii]|uniref:Uncharacterized protein n=1 Tax=Paenibacillus aestuarii TaxID=516965 RepID=A0ABW0KH20_9BACL|nr:hypothetical protein [Paenibacillus aestuarii]